MSSWQLLNHYLHTWGRAFAAMLRVLTWTPFVVLLLVQLALVALLYFGVRPPLSGVLRSLPDWFLPASFFDYPSHLLLLPSVLYNRLLPIVGLFLESLLQAAATWIFVRHARSQSLPGLGPAISEVKWGYGQFLLFSLLNFLLLRGYGELLSWAIGDFWAGYSRRQIALEFLQTVVGAALNSVLAYCTVVIVVERTRPLATLALSLRTAFRRGFATWATVFAGTILTWPFSLMLTRAPEWIGRFNPEVVVLLTVLSLMATTVASYLVTSVLTTWYLLHRRPG